MKIILGKSNTGKSKYVYESIKDNINNNINSILFVPSQSRANSEVRFMDTLGVSGIIGVNITTISEYISYLCKKINIHFDENYISKLDKKIILTKVITKNPSLFKVFKKVKSKQGFFDLLNIYMDIFRKEDVDTNKINNISLNNKLLENKIKEISRIYEKFNEEITDKYIDNVDEVDLVLKNIWKIKELFKNTFVYFDGYNNFTNIEYKFIELLLKLGVNITITLTTDISSLDDIYLDNTDEIFEVPNKTYKKLLKIASKTGNEKVDSVFFFDNHSNSDSAITYLADNVFKSNVKKFTQKQDAVYLNVYANMYKEIENVASKINYYIRNNKRFKDFCIYTTDLENYENIISRVFYEYNIPFYVDSKRSIENSKLTLYILNILDMGISSRYNFKNVINILKLGLNDILAEDISYLENYVYEFNIDRYSLLMPFSLNNTGYNEIIYDISRLNDIREKINNIFYNFIQKINECKYISEYVEIIYTHLKENNIFENFEKYLLDIEDAPYQIYKSSLETQVWDKICECFDSIYKVYNNEKINLNEFLDILKMLVKDIYIKTIPSTLDKVILADINVSKIEKKDIVFFVGVTQGNFPKLQEQDILFNDYEIEKLRTLDFDFKETSISKENMAKFNIYQAICNTKEKLYISMPSTDILGNSTRKSNFITSVEKLLNVKLIGDIAISDTSKMEVMYSKEKSFEYMVNLLKEVLNDNLENKDINIDSKKIEEIVALYNYLKNDEKYEEIMEYVKDDNNLSKEIVDDIYQNEFKSSVYKLEMFRKCPFSYYMKYVLNLSKRKVYEISTIDTGTFMHDVIEEFSKYLLEKNIMWHEIIDDDDVLKLEYKDILENVISKTLDEDFKKQKESVKYGIYKRKLTNTLKKVVVIIAKSFKQSEFVPFGYEIEFKENGNFLPIDINLGNGKKMKLIGKIDRVDVLKTKEAIYTRIVDYKSSKKELLIDDIKEGISLQLIAYLTAFMENEQKNETRKVIPAACTYFNLSSSLVNLKGYEKDEQIIKKEIIESLRMRGIFLKDIEILEKMDTKIEDSSSKIIDISVGRYLENSKKALDEEDFFNLCNEVKEILKDIGNEMLQGIVKILPNKKAQHCKYCEFSNICRKDLCI